MTHEELRQQIATEMADSYFATHPDFEHLDLKARLIEARKYNHSYLPLADIAINHMAKQAREARKDGMFNESLKEGSKFRQSTNDYLKSKGLKD